MGDSATAVPDFDTQYASLVKEPFRQQVERDRAAGADLLAQAREYAGRGKPEFVLAYLVGLALPDPEKRDLLASAFERRAEISEQTAAALDAEHHRPFPLIGIEARKDRTLARQIRAGKMINPYARAARPLNMR
jgi:hypothetical protein